MTTMQSNKSVSETLQDLRALFGRYEIEEWEPIRVFRGTIFTLDFRQKIAAAMGLPGVLESLLGSSEARR